MLRRIRLHIIAVLSISIVIMMAYGMMFQLKPADPQAVVNRFKVFILSATWGENCNTNIRAAIAAGVKREPESDENANKLPAKSYELVRRNNVLEVTGNVCNGQLVCAFKASKKIYNEDPFPGCYKNLEITYRCTDLDRVRAVHSREGEDVKLDCTPKDDKQAGKNPDGTHNAPAAAQ